MGPGKTGLGTLQEHVEKIVIANYCLRQYFTEVKRDGSQLSYGGLPRLIRINPCHRLCNSANSLCVVEMDLFDGHWVRLS